MQALHRQAEATSGISRAAVDAARNANLHDRLGSETFRSLSRHFYTRVYNDSEFRKLFANTTQEAAQRNQSEFLIQEFGGPRLYEQRKGHTALLGRHGPYAVDGKGAVKWLQHMNAALDETEMDKDSRELLRNYFGHMAWWVVYGRELVNPSRTVGYYGKHREGEI